jgi:dihydrodipicolinate synthase/N-acetylneuraminate lyase
MDTTPHTADRLRRSVIAVPPLARDESGKISATENAKIIRHIEGGGVDLLLYGGNALLYHVRPSEYASLLGMLADSAAPGTGIIPSVGPAFGLMMDQAEVLSDFDFPTVMILPQQEITDPVGIAAGVSAFAARLQRPVVLYLKFDRWLPVEAVRSLVDDGVVSWIKYAVVRDDPAQDDYLRELVDQVSPQKIISGIGEQPAIVHLRDFGVWGFTSGCVCVAPGRSMEMMRAIHEQRYDEAESLRRRFCALEDLRNAIHPIRVLHHAVGAAGIAETGPLLPLVSDLAEDEAAQVAAAARELLAWERQAVGSC